MTITLSYGAGKTSRAFSKALSVKGFKPGDAHEVYPRLRPELMGGKVFKKQVGFRRIFTIDLGIITAVADLEHIGQWLANESQYLTFSYTLDYASATEGAEEVSGGSTAAGYIEFDLDTVNPSWTVGDTIYISGVTGLTPTLPDANYALSTIEDTDTVRIAESGYSGTPASGSLLRKIDSITETDLQVVDNYENQFASRWTDGVESGRHVIISCTEKSGRTAYPT